MTNEHILKPEDREDFILSLKDQVMVDINTRTSSRKQTIRIEKG